MRKLTPEGEQAIAEIAERHGASIDAVKTLLEAVANGGGTMAQFNHPELGGGGQWLRGGMTMVGDMFNHSLKAKVDGICAELSDRLASGGFAPPSGSFQSQSQGGGGYGGMSSNSGGVSFFAQDTTSGSGHWWPTDLGNPSATGAQNSVRYAFFPEKGRLAIDHNGRVDVYDTLDHFIQGFGQQQGGGSSLTFTSQHGLVRIDSLPRIGGAQEASALSDTPPHSPAHNQKLSAFSEPSVPANADSDAIFATLERLAGLKEKGILTEEEFAAKKAELLKRL